MSIEHSTIADADRHEVKHASTAVAGTVLVANGDGTTKFDAVSYNNLSNKPTAKGYIPELYGISIASNQAPTATNTPLQIEFGAAQATSNVQLASNGVITFLVAGQYILRYVFRIGRTTGTGTAVLFTRVLKNGTQFRNSNSFTLTDTNTVITFSQDIIIDAAVNDNYKFEIVRDSSGINNGGLYQTVPTVSGWNVAPTATVAISKFTGLV